MTTLGDVLARLRIDDRGWTVLHLRYGVGAKQTLEKIGKSFDLTRERIRQIEEKALLRLKNGTLVLSDVCNGLEKRHVELGVPFAPDTTRRAVLRSINKVLSDINVPGSVSERYRLIMAMRAEQEKYSKTWPNLTYLFCSLPEPIILHPRVRLEIAEQRKAQRQYSYTELAHRVLEEKGAPMHWHEVLERVERLKRRKNVLASPLFNTLVHRKDIFVRVGPGTYGLVKWGLKKRLSNIELIVKYLINRRCTASFGEIVQLVGIPSGIKKKSLQMSLELNPRFYKSIEGEYGLRAWLPAREKQTLRSARWQIEAQDSHARVGRARDRGWDVEAICASDKPLASSGA